MSAFSDINYYELRHRTKEILSEATEGLNRRIQVLKRYSLRIAAVEAEVARLKKELSDDLPNGKP